MSALPGRGSGNRAKGSSGHRITGPTSVAVTGRDSDVAASQSVTQQGAPRAVNRRIVRSPSSTSLASRSSQASATDNPLSSEMSDDELRGWPTSKKRRRLDDGYGDDDGFLEEPDDGRKITLTMDQATGDPVPMPRPVRQSTGNSNAGGGDDWGALGRKYLRVVDVFEDIRHVVGSGYNIEQANGKIEIHTNDADEREAEKEAERLAQLYQIYRGLLAIRPNLHTYIFNTLAEDPDSDIIRHIGGIMERAKSSARGTDISRINDKLPGWLNNSELIVKASRGFCHRDTAQLLMPAKMPYTETLRKMYLDGEEKLTSSHIPRFCYDVDPDQDGKGGQGLFFSRLPRLAGVCILRGPSAVNVVKGSSGYQAQSSRATKKSNSDRHQIMKVTAPLIAYMHTLVYYALTNATSFQATPHGFPIRAFYYKFIQKINDTSPAVRKKLFKKWNKLLWPHHHGESDEENDDDWDIALNEEPESDREYGANEEPPLPGTPSAAS